MTWARGPKLRLPARSGVWNTRGESLPAPPPEPGNITEQLDILKGCALIRELHIMGRVVSIDESTKDIYRSRERGRMSRPASTSRRCTKGSRAWPREPRARPPASRVHRLGVRVGVEGFNVQRFRGGLVFKAHRLLYHPTLGVRVIKKKKKHTPLTGSPAACRPRRPPPGPRLQWFRDGRVFEAHRLLYQSA